MRLRLARWGLTPPGGPPATTPAMAAKAGIPMLAPPPGSGYTLRSTILHTRKQFDIVSSNEEENT